MLFLQLPRFRHAAKTLQIIAKHCKLSSKLDLACPFDINTIRINSGAACLPPFGTRSSTWNVAEDLQRPHVLSPDVMMLQNLIDVFDRQERCSMDCGSKIWILRTGMLSTMFCSPYSHRLTALRLAICIFSPPIYHPSHLTPPCSDLRLLRPLPPQI